MPENKPNSLPHVLTGYNPEYNPETTPFARTRSSRQCSRDSRRSNASPTRERSPAKSSKSATSSAKLRSDRRTRRYEAKRFEELSNKWDQAKQEVRIEDHELLREKVALQQELIRKQDEYAEQRRLSEANEEAEKREAQKALKQAKEEELQKICKESLEADKKSQRKSKGKLKKDGSASPTTPAPTTVPSSPTKSPTTPPSAGCRHRMNPFKTSLQPMAPTPDLGESDSEEEEMVIKKDIPWHEQQLYKLYGKNADYFLHPKIENKAQVKKSNPKLRRQGGRAGADILWQTLRQDSNQRLLQEDATIPKQLKDAYGAFARQSLRKNRIPVQRMFCEENDLPEMPRLLNNEKLKEVKKMRHKTDLMYRASVANQDRTEVLKFNNPMPEFGEGGVSEYLPSWYDDDSEDSVPEYMRWLMASAGGQGLENVQEEVEEDSPLKPAAPPSQLKPTAPQLTQSMDDNLVQYMRRKPQATKPKQKYVFLTDKDTESQGVFSEKYKGERENKDIPQPYKGDLPKSMSAMGGMISATPDPVSKSVTMTPYSAPQHRHGNQRPIQTTWQPLSMHALVEYKKQVDTTGAGDFNMGRTKMWSQIPVI